VLGTDSVGCVYELTLGRDEHWPTIVGNRGELRLDNRVFVAEWDKDHDQPTQEQRLGPLRLQLASAPEIGRPFKIEGWGTADDGLDPDARGKMIPKAQALFRESILRVIDSWRFVPVARGFNHPFYPLQDHPNSEIFSAGPYDQTAAELASTLGMRQTLERRTANLVRDVTGVRIAVRFAEQRQATVRSDTSRAADGSFPIVNEGFGTNQLVFVMAQLAQMPRGGLIGIEEPETHLHPRAVARLGDVLVRVATAEDKQILLTTHSEHLLPSLLNNVAESKLSADDLKIYYCAASRGDFGQPALSGLEPGGACPLVPAHGLAAAYPRGRRSLVHDGHLAIPLQCRQMLHPRPRRPASARRRRLLEQQASG
jgi:hypothetical protein